MSEKVIEKTVTGVVALTTTQGVLLVVTLLTGIALARLLQPEDVGAYALINGFVLAAYFFTDVGLAGTLIQRPEEPSRQHLRTVFTIQMGLAIVLACGMILLSPQVIEFCRLDERLRWAFPLLGLILLATPVESVSGVVLERRLRYSAVSLAHLVGSICSAGVSLALAVMGAGVWSLIGGSVAASFSRALVVMISSRWPIGLAFEREFLRRSLPSGIPYQLGGILPLVRDNVPMLWAGLLFGPAWVGYLAWARTVTFSLANVFAHAWARVAYSATARLHQKSSERSLVIEKMTLTLLLVMLPLSASLVGLRRPIISIIFTDKWLEAVPALAFFGLRMVGASLVTLFGAFLNGDGQFHRVARILSVWTLLEVGAASVLGALFGPIGIAMAAAGSVWVPALWMIHVVMNVTSFRIEKILVKPTFAALICGLFLEAMSGYVTGLASLVIVWLTGLMVYLTLVLLIIPEVSADILKGLAWARRRALLGQL